VAATGENQNLPSLLFRRDVFIQPGGPGQEGDVKE
jgi:hypothetical protein